MSTKRLTAKQGVEELIKLKPNASTVDGLRLLRRLNEVSTAILKAKLRANLMD